MDQSALVADLADAGRRFVERFAADGNAVRAAFWGRPYESDRWRLHVATDAAARVGLVPAYRSVSAALGVIKENRISGSDVTLLSLADPIAADVLAFVARSPDRLPARVGGRTLGRVVFDDLYVYPPGVFTFNRVDPMTTEDVGREIVRLMTRGPGAFQPSRVTLKDGTTFNGVPFALQIGSQKTVVAQFIADGEPAPQVVRLDEIDAIT